VAPLIPPLEGGGPGFCTDAIQLFPDVKLRAGLDPIHHHCKMIQVNCQPKPRETCD